MKYRKKPVEVEAIQFTSENKDDVLGFQRNNGLISYHTQGTLQWLEIKTLEGRMRAEIGDWIICGVKGELYPCKPDIFALTYEEIGTPPCPYPDCPKIKYHDCPVHGRSSPPPILH